MVPHQPHQHEPQFTAHTLRLDQNNDYKSLHKSHKYIEYTCIITHIQVRADLGLQKDFPLESHSYPSFDDVLK